MKRDPFRIEGPAVVSFSGGRTSAYMLRRILESHGGVLPSDVHVLFANTGKERQETLDFVQACTQNWGVYVHWLELRFTEDGGASFAEVTHATASRNGEPFTALHRKRGFLPNPVTRFCTQELKIRPMKSWMLAQGYEHWTNVVGIRADEPSRVHRMRNTQRKERWDVALPLAEAGVSNADVRAFWNAQPFDLALRSWEGNCDLCFLKGADKLVRILRERPDLGVWWAEAEAEAKSSKQSGARFRNDRPSYARLAQIAEQPPLPGFFDENHGAVIDCMCGDDMESGDITGGAQ